VSVSPFVVVPAIVGGPALTGGRVCGAIGNVVVVAESIVLPPAGAAGVVAAGVVVVGVVVVAALAVGVPVTEAEMEQLREGLPRRQLDGSDRRLLWTELKLEQWRPR
jgi:hypothetical protein